MVESKRWLRPLDRRSGGREEGIAPSTQMLRYLRRMDDLTSGHLRWGILTNGARWRLHFQGARSVDAPLGEVHDAALVVLYRLLFILYAEDRDLLRVRDERYDDYGLRDKVRGDVGRRKDRGDAFSETAARYWSAIDDLCRAVDAGDSSIGLPPFDGGLFDRESAPLLSRIRLGDRVMADVIDALSFEAAPEGRRYINYRDLSVQQLGSIYERLLEHEIALEEDEIVVRPNVFARKGSGNYYTPDELVGLILDETIGPLVRARLEAFATETEKLRKSRRRLRFRLAELKRLDPASRLLDLKVCDPAMDRVTSWSASWITWRIG